MKIHYEALKKAASILSEAAHEDSKLSPIVDCLREMLANENPREPYADIIDRNMYLATILWEKGDIGGALSEAGVEPTEDNVVALINNADMKKSMEEQGVAAGWEAVDHVISEMIENGDLECS